MEFRGEGGDGLAPAPTDSTAPTDPGKIHYVVREWTSYPVLPYMEH